MDGSDGVIELRASTSSGKIEPAILQDVDLAAREDVEVGDLSRIVLCDELNLPPPRRCSFRPLAWTDDFE